VHSIRLTILPPSYVVMESGNLNFLEPSGPLQACNGTALPLPLLILWSCMLFETFDVYPGSHLHHNSTDKPSMIRESNSLQNMEAASQEPI